MAGFFKNHRRLSLVAGLPCLVALVVIMLTGCQVRQNSHSGFTGYNAEALLKNKTAYAGDNSKVVNLIDNLPYANLRRGVSLQTQSVPYGITVDYDFSGVNLDTGQIKSSLRDNAIVMFALIDNVDEVTFSAKGTTPTFICHFSRDEMQKIYDHDLREYSKDINTLKILLRSLSFRLHVYPEKYALIMSSAPGIRIMTEYRGSAAKARYSAESGTLFTWEASTGKMSKGLPAIELPLDTPVYWSPLDPAGQVSGGRKNLVTVTLLDEQGRRIDEKQVTILYDGSLYYTVQPAMDIVIGGETPYLNQKAVDLERAVGLAIKSRSNVYGAGETATEGHIILDSEGNDGTVKVYAIASLGVFGFENGIFTIVSGSGAIPTVMIFSRNENGKYSLLEYKEPMDGALYMDSIKQMFPQKLQDRVLSSQGDYDYLVKQQEKQAVEYLKDIGRTAEVSAAYVNKKPVNINVDASNKLFSEFAKYDSFLNCCPDWIGTRERIEDSVRYIYETAQDKTDDGYDLIVFRKTKEDGAIVEERQYKIEGDEPQLMGPGR